MAMNEQGLAEYSEIRYLKPDDCRFERTNGGLLRLTFEEKTYERIHLLRAFPLSAPERFISVRDADMKELGIIADLNAFEQAQAEILKEELDRRYFTPKITGIGSIKEEFGYSYWQVETDKGERGFTVRGHEGVIPLGGGRLLVLDVDGNRYEILDYRTLDPKSFKFIDNLI